MQELDANISFLYLLLHKTTQGFEISTYRKPASTDALIPFSSNHPIGHKRAALRFFLSRMHQLPLTYRNEKLEWNVILHIAKTNGFPLSLHMKLNTGMLHIRQHHHVYPILII